MIGVIGVDPSIAATGIAWPDGRLYTSRGPTKDGDRRLVKLRDDLEDGIVLARLLVPGGRLLAVIEDLPARAMAAGLTGRAQGVVREILHRLEVPYVTVVPSTVKKQATGSGVAKKPQMREAWLNAEGIDDPGPEVDDNQVDDNQVDAYWLRQIGLRYLQLLEGVPLETAPDLSMIDWKAWDNALA